MIYVNQHQFNELKTSLNTTLSCLGTGVKASKSNDVCSKLLGFKDYNTFKAIGLLETITDEQEEVHLERISEYLRAGNYLGLLEGTTEFHYWMLRVELNDHSTVSAQDRFTNHEHDFKLWSVFDDDQHLLNQYYDEIVGATKEGEWGGIIKDSDSKRIQWHIECPLFVTGKIQSLMLSAAEIALIAANFQKLYGDQIGSKLWELMPTLLPSCEGEDIGDAEDIEDNLQPFYAARHKLIQQYIADEDWEALSVIQYQDYEELSKKCTDEGLDFELLYHPSYFAAIPGNAHDQLVKEIVDQAKPDFPETPIEVPERGSYDDLFAGLSNLIAQRWGGMGHFQPSLLMKADLDSNSDEYIALHNEQVGEDQICLVLSGDGAFTVRDLKGEGVYTYVLDNPTYADIHIQLEFHYGASGKPVTDYTAPEKLIKIGEHLGIPAYTLLMGS
ncbi:hypothetical protein [Neptuniibacter sp. QD37_11]|uniref:hypothetical protein n=1 Tax=Neptuniibacter sp. QD37_11 TaxID=3398209 RepID=UPI0039F5A4A8